MYILAYSLILVDPFKRKILSFYSNSCLRCKFFPVISSLGGWSLFIAVGSGSSENEGAYRNSLLLN